MTISLSPLLYLILLLAILSYSKDEIARSLIFGLIIVVILIPLGKITKKQVDETIKEEMEQNGDN